MKLSNRFSNIDKIRVWGDNPYSALSGSNNNCSIHHIYSTSVPYANSILNGIMLDENEHRTADGHNQYVMGDERRIKYLFLAIRQAIKSGYQFKQRDYKFLEAVKLDYLKTLEMWG